MSQMTLQYAISNKSAYADVVFHLAAILKGWINLYKVEKCRGLEDISTKANRI